MNGRKVVAEFLAEKGINEIPQKMQKLCKYVDLLTEENKTLNLISRRVEKEDIWIIHILDSLLPVGRMELSGKTVLDFGTGGGLPGIPLKIIFPACYMYLLDSRQRKAEALKKIIKKLDLQDCLAICSRVELLDKSWHNYFDIVVSRSVKIEEKYWKSLCDLSNRSGVIYLYKAKKLDDMEIMSETRKHDISHELVGTRTLVELRKEDVPRGT